MADDLRSFAADLRTLGVSLSGSDLRDMVTVIAVEAKKDVEKEVGRAIGFDLSMRGWRNGQLKFRSGFDLESDGVAILKPRPPGPWVVLEEGRFPGRKKARRGKYRGRTVGWGATRGKRPWRKAEDRIDAQMEKWVEAEVAKRIQRHLGV